MKKTLLLTAVMALWAARAIAASLPPDIEAKVEAKIQEFKQKNAAKLKDACGQMVHVTTATGTEERDTWGCNSPPGIVQYDDAYIYYGVGQEQSTQDAVHVVYEMYFDLNKSSVLVGRIGGKDGKPKKHAKIRLVNTRTGAAFEEKAKPDGYYEIHVPSGVYLATVSEKGCSSEDRTLELCAFGPASGPTKAHGPFNEDFELDCQEFQLRAVGVDTIDMNYAGDGAHVTGGDRAEIDGCLPFDINSDTGAISGQGDLIRGAGPAHVNAVGSGITGFGTGARNPVTLTYSVTGQVNETQASFVVQCLHQGAMQVDAEATVCDEDGCHHGQGSSGDAGGDCGRQIARFTLPLEEGATYPFHEAWQQGGLSYASDIDFTLTSSCSSDTAPPPPASPPSGNNGSAGSGASGGGGSQGGGSGSGGAGGSGGSMGGEGRKVVREEVEEVPLTEEELEEYHRRGGQAQRFPYPFTGGGAQPQEEAAPAAGSVMQDALGMVQSFTDVQDIDAGDYTDYSVDE